LKTVYLGLGSNMGNREAALQQAIRILHSQDLRIRRLSSVYETSPQENVAQPWFLNMVLQAETTLFPMRLLLRAMNVEMKMGRKRHVAKGPRIIDVDILLYGNTIVNSQRLQIPHPGIPGRRFVLEPLAELTPDLRHPVNQRTMRDLLSGTTEQSVKKVAFRPEIPEI
jgi:2-amino-4-hydroxy-6-hydroxymethyldihydropteridine diphosphokinase